jgi:hypothetical protein
MLDIFRQDAFSVLSLTDSINDLVFAPGRIAEMGLFTSRSITTTSAVLEKKGNALVLVAPTPRGAPGITVPKKQGNIRQLPVPHFEINDAIMAEEVQGVRAFGTEDQVETVMGRIAEREAEHSQSMAATTEYSQLGAIKGVVTYADGSTLDLFAEFGVTQVAEIDFDLDNASPAEGVLRKKCAGVVRTIAAELGGLPWSGMVRALVGDAFFDDLLAHKEVRDSYKGWTEAQILREGYIEASGKSYGAFEFGGIVWENYRGAVGATSFIETDKAHFFPMNVPGLFRQYWAPADYIETVNTPGRRLYAKQWPMPNDKGVNLDVQMNELNIATRPRSLLKGKRT